MYDVHHCCVYNEKLLMMDRGTVPKHVEFYSKNKPEKLVHFVGFCYKNISPNCNILGLLAIYVNS